MSGRRVYLDHAATTPLSRAASAAMRPWLVGALDRSGATDAPDRSGATSGLDRSGETGGVLYGNPSGFSGEARAARKALDEARDRVAVHLGARPREVVFTSGGTEALNAAVVGSLLTDRVRPGDAVVVSAIEHDAVRRPVDEWARRLGLEVRVTPVSPHGLIDLDGLAELLDDRVRLVATMAVNNEVGTIQPVAAIVELVRRLAPGALHLCDAVCAPLWVDVAEVTSGADLVAVAAHKFGGPMGIGALAIRGDAELVPLLWGGGQEAERRSGTPNVAGAVGMAAALDSLAVAGDERRRSLPVVARRRDRLVDGLVSTIEGCRETGERAAKVAGNAHVCIDGVESESLLLLLDGAGVAASAGSACASGALHASHVLLAMGVPERLALGSLRLTLSYGTTDDEVDQCLAAVREAVTRLRGAAA